MDFWKAVTIASPTLTGSQLYKTTTPIETVRVKKIGVRLDLWVFVDSGLVFCDLVGKLKELFGL